VLKPFCESIEDDDDDDDDDDDENGRRSERVYVCLYY
jgi:hypothetical protein